MIDLAKKLYKSINENDIEAALKLFDAQAVRVEFKDTTFRSLSELKVNFTQGRSTWAEGSCSPEEFIANKNKLVIWVHVHVRQKDKTEWIDAYVADGMAFKDGKIIEFHSFMKKEEALQWANIAV